MFNNTQTVDDYIELLDGRMVRKDKLFNLLLNGQNDSGVYRKKIDPLLIAKELQERYRFVTLRDTKEILVYRDGIYCPNGETFIEQGAKELLQDDFTSHKVNEILNSIRYSTYRDRADFDKDKEIINVENGLLNIKTMELKPHSPDHLSVVRIPLKYNHGVDCPLIKRFIAEVVEPEDISLISE